MAEIKDIWLSCKFSPKRLKTAFFLSRDNTIKSSQAKVIISTKFPIHGKLNSVCSESQTVADTAEEQTKI